MTAEPRTTTAERRLEIYRAAMEEAVEIARDEEQWPDADVALDHMAGVLVQALKA